MAAIGVDGRWVIIQFKTATLDTGDHVDADRSDLGPERHRSTCSAPRSTATPSSCSPIRRCCASPRAPEHIGVAKAIQGRHLRRVDRRRHGVELHDLGSFVSAALPVDGSLCIDSPSRPPTPDRRRCVPAAERHLALGRVGRARRGDRDLERRDRLVGLLHARARHDHPHRGRGQRRSGRRCDLAGRRRYTEPAPWTPRDPAARGRARPDTRPPTSSSTPRLDTQVLRSMRSPASLRHQRHERHRHFPGCAVRRLHRQLARARRRAHLRLKRLAQRAASGGASPLTTKGDIYTYSTVDDRLPVGSNYDTVMADSATATGLKWGVPAIPSNSQSGNYTIAATDRGPLH